MIALRLAYPVSANRYWRTTVAKGLGRAITHLSSEAKSYKRDTAVRAAVAGIRKPSKGWVALDLVLHPPEPQDAAARARKLGPHWHMLVRCIDIDNAVKVTLDALQDVLYENDAQVVSLRIRRGMPVPDGALVVRFGKAEIASIDPDRAPDLLEA